MPVFSKHNSLFTLVLIIGLFLVLPFLAFPEIIFGGQTVWWTDLSWMHYPRHIFAAEEWLAGRVPLWDPYQHNGLPFLAETQVGALYLFSAIFLSPLSPSLELSLYILIHFSLAAIFTFILARLLGLAYVPATVAALAFGFGGFLMAQVTNLNIMTGAVWLPLILYGIIQTNRRRSGLTALLAGIPLAMQIYTSQPQIVFYTLVIMGSYALYRLPADLFGNHSPQKGNIRYALQSILLMATVLLSGLLLASPQWLSTLELQQLSARSEERGFNFLTENSLPPAMLLNLLVPSAFGNNVTGFKGGDPFQEDFIYIGFIPLVLLFFSVRQRHKQDVPYFFLLLVGATLLSIGKYTPLYEYIIQYLPGFALFRIPARWLMAVNLALAILAGFGLQTILKRGITRLQLAAIVGAGAIILAATGFAWIFRDSLTDWSNNWSKLHQTLLSSFFRHGYTVDSVHHSRMLLGQATWLTAPVNLLIFNVGATLALFIAFAVQKISKPAFSKLLVILLCVDLIAAGGTTINPIRPDSWWTQLSGSAQYVLQNVGSARIFPLGMGSEQATVTHLGQYFPSVYRVRSAGGHGSSLMLKRTSTFLEEAHPVQAIQVLGVRHLLTEGQMGADAAATYPIVYSDESGFVYKNPNPLPRAFMVHHAIWVNTADKALAHFKDVKVDPAKTVIIESGQPIPPTPKIAASGPVTIVAEDSRQIKIDVTANENGYLVLLDTFYPGWQATIDHQPTSIFRANYVARAVYVPAGKHTVEFKYHPQMYQTGLWLKLLTLAAIVVCLIKNGVPKTIKNTVLQLKPR